MNFITFVDGVATRGGDSKVVRKTRLSTMDAAGGRRNLDAEGAMDTSEDSYVI